MQRRARVIQYKVHAWVWGENTVEYRKWGGFPPNNKLLV